MKSLFNMIARRMTPLQNRTSILIMVIIFALLSLASCELGILPEDYAAIADLVSDDGLLLTEAALWYNGGRFEQGSPRYDELISKYGQKTESGIVSIPIMKTVGINYVTVEVLWHSMECNGYNPEIGAGTTWYDIRKVDGEWMIVDSHRYYEWRSSCENQVDVLTNVVLGN